jgi:quercetin dioxygenase-like cupin family protein
VSETISLGPIVLRFLHSRESTDASLDLFEMTVQPGGQVPVTHYHRDWDETIYGLQGTTTWRVADQDIGVGPNQPLFIKRGVVHNFSNRTDRPAVCLCILTPGRLGPQYFREIAALAASGPPDPAAMRETMMRHGLVPVPAG